MRYNEQLKQMEETHHKEVSQNYFFITLFFFFSIIFWNLKVLMFNDISTFLGYLMPNPSF